MSAVMHDLALREFEMYRLRPCIPGFEFRAVFTI